MISWGRVHRLSRSIAHSIRQDGFQPDIVVAVARGGYVPARLLCDLLDIYDLTSIRILHYAAGAEPTGQARLLMPLAVDVRNKNVLLVDDVADSGDTLHLACQHIAQRAVAALRVAVLHHKKVSTLTPDYYGQKIITWRWLIYPWAVVEDVAGFIATMQPRPATLAMAKDRLEDAFGIRVSFDVLEDALVLSKKWDNHNIP